MQGTLPLLERNLKSIWGAFHGNRQISRVNSTLASSHQCFGNCSLHATFSRRHTSCKAVFEDTALSIGESYENARQGNDWARLSGGLTFGACPRSPQDLETLVSQTGINAFVLFETGEECERVGLDWEKFQEKASQQGVVAVRVSMNSDDREDQISSLPEAIRSLATFSSLGYKLHFSCMTGVHNCPLIALGYLTFLEGMEVEKAIEVINKSCPSAMPVVETWEEVKVQIGSSNMRRVSELARQLADNRNGERDPKDWLDAHKMYMMEAIQQRVETNVSIVSTVAQIETAKATKEISKELASSKKVAEELQRTAAYSKDRIEYFQKQVAALKKREDSAKTSAAAVMKDRESLQQQIYSLKVQDDCNVKTINAAQEQVAKLSSMVELYRKREGELQVHAESVGVEVHALQGKLWMAAQDEAAAKKELMSAEERVRSLSAKFTAVERSVVEAMAAKSQAKESVRKISVQIRELATLDRRAMAEKIFQLEKEQSAAISQAKQVEERLSFLYRQKETLRAKEESATLALRLRKEKVQKLANQLSSLQLMESEARKTSLAVGQEVTALQSQVSDLVESLEASKKEAREAKEKLRLQKAKYSELVEARGSELVLNLKSELRKAKEKESVLSKSLATKEEKVSSLLRRMEDMTRKEQVTKMATQDRISLFNRQVSDLRSKLAAADALVARNNEKLDSLSLQVVALQKLEEDANFTTAAAGEKVLYFTRQAEELKRKEAEASETAMAATEKARQLEQKVLALEQSEAGALSQAMKFSESIGSLIKINSELGAELEEAKERETKLVEALDQGMEMLNMALDSDNTIDELRMAADMAAKELLSERLRADKLSAELEKEMKKSADNGRSPSAPPSAFPGLPLGQLAFATAPALADFEADSQSTAASAKSDSHFALLRNVLLGALAAAAVPLTLTALISGNPQMDGVSSGGRSGLGQIISRAASAESVCSYDNDNRNCKKFE